jgi:transposase
VTNNFRSIDRQTGFLLPPSVDEWLPEKHLARFIVEVIDGLDLRAMSGSYRGSGSASYHPCMLLGILVYGYATGVFSSRKLERATYDSVAFRFIAANDHPDHDTIAAFRRRFLKEIEALFVEVLQVAREMGVLKMGTIGLDGTKIHANASRHSALSYEHACKIEAQLKAEVADLMAKAEAADAVDIPDGLSIPEELARREERLAKLAAARAKIEARAKERYARELAEHDAKLAAREVKIAATGKKPGGKPPQPPAEGPRPDDQINLTDEESRIMAFSRVPSSRVFVPSAAMRSAGPICLSASFRPLKRYLEPRACLPRRHPRTRMASLGGGGPMTAATGTRPISPTAASRPRPPACTALRKRPCWRPAMRRRSDSCIPAGRCLSSTTSPTCSSSRRWCRPQPPAFDETPSGDPGHRR